MGQKERTENITNSYPNIDLNMEGIETEREKSVDWQSVETDRQINYVVVGGGAWGDTWMKSLSLSSTNKLVGTELMRVEQTKNSTTGITSKTVFVDVIKLELGKLSIISYAYPQDNDGLIEEMGIKDESVVTSLEEYLEELKTENIRTARDLPDRIDVDETIRLFLEQIEERSFGMPVLIPA